MAKKPPASPALTQTVCNSCVGFLTGKSVPVTDPHDPVSLAQAMLVYMGVGDQHPINGVVHALRVIDCFYKSRVAPHAPQPQPQPAKMTKRERRAMNRAKKQKWHPAKVNRKSHLDREYEAIMGPVPRA